MKELVEKIIEINYEDLENLKGNFPINQRFGLSVFYKKVQYDFLIHFKLNSEKIFCFGSGVLPPADKIKFKNRPVFKRQSWDLLKEMNVSTIFYNDPTRYTFPSLSGTWGVGSPDDYYLENIAMILSKIFNLNSINNSDVVFYSSSMGGFMSIQLATMIPETIAWADIPQTDIRNFGSYRILINTIFSEYEDLSQFYPRFDCLELIKQKNYVPKIYMVMDIGIKDLLYHFIPFFNNIRKLKIYDLNNNNLKILLNPVKSHTFLSYEQFISVKNNFSNFSNFNDIDDLSILKDTNVTPLIHKFGKYIPISNDNLKLLLEQTRNSKFIDDSEELEDKINHLQKNILMDESKIDNLIKENKKLNEVLESKNNQINELNHFKKEVLSSKSWKITGFLRNIKNKFFN